MKKNISKYFLLILITEIFFSCSPKIPFTPELRSKIEYQGIDITDVQFYNSKKIILNREEIEPEAVEIESGDIKINNKKVIEEITIKKNTPGICIEANPYDLSICFEENTSNTLTFGRKNGNKLEYAYRLYAKKWSSNNSGKILYGDTIYRTQPGAGSAILLVKKKQFYQLIKQKRTVRGQKIRH